MKATVTAVGLALAMTSQVWGIIGNPTPPPPPPPSATCTHHVPKTMPAKPSCHAVANSGRHKQNHCLKQVRFQKEAGLEEDFLGAY